MASGNQGPEDIAGSRSPPLGPAEPSDAARSGPARYPPDRWLLVSVVLPSPGESLLLIDALRSIGARAVEREGDRLVARLPPPADVESTLREVAAAVRLNTSLSDGDVRWSWQAHEDWAERWRREVAPRRVSERIVVAPAGAAAAIREGDVLIRLEPGTAFGTAEHATTRTCLRFLESLIRRGDRIADIGAGSGILSIAAALLGASSVLAVEADPLACAAAAANARSNGVAELVEVRELTVDRRRLGRLGRSNGVLANLAAPILLGLLPGMRRVLLPGGWAVVSGATRADRDSLVRVGRSAGLELAGEAVEDGWWTGRFTDSR